MADWYGTLADEIKTNVNKLREAFFQRYRKSNIESTLTNIKQGQTETMDDYIDRIIRESRDSGVPENILVGLRPDVAGIVMPQTPRTMQQLRSVASVAEKTLTVTNNRPLTQLSVQVANLSKMEDRMMDGLSNKRPPNNSRINTQYQRRPSCNYCDRFCFENVCRKVKRNQAISTQNRSVQR